MSIGKRKEEKVSYDAKERSAWIKKYKIEMLLKPTLVKVFSVAVCSLLLVALTRGVVRAANGECPKEELVCFSSNSPAKASEVNSNFTKVVDWIEQKVGGVGKSTSVGTSDISTVGSVNSGSINTSGLVKTGALDVGGNMTFSSAAPRYSTWESAVKGDGGVSIVNDNDIYKELMIVGNNSNANYNGRRQVGIWDNAIVHGVLDAEDIRSPTNKHEDCVNSNWIDSATKQNADKSQGHSDWFHCPDGRYVAGIRILNSTNDNQKVDQIEVRCCAL